MKIRKQISTGSDISMSLSADGGLMIKDNGGTRSGKDRRKLSIINRNPERRIIKVRRSGRDRRRELKCRDCFAIERRDAFRSIHKNVS